MDSKFVFILITAFVATTKADKYLTERPSFLSSCKTTDSDFNKCLAGNFQAFFVQWKDGVPGLSSVGKLDPLLVKRVKIAQDGTRALTLNMDLQNLVVSGAGNAIMQDVKFDTKNWKIVGRIHIPKLHFDSDYKVKGNVLTLQLNSAGKSQYIADNLVVTIQLALKLRDDGDITFTEIEHTLVTIKEIGGFHMQIDNLFNGQKELEVAANELFNNNWRDLFEALRPAIEQTITKVFDDRLKKIFHYVPATYFIANIPKAAEVYG